MDDSSRFTIERLLPQATAAALLLGAATAAWAAPVGSVYPAPAGNTFSGTGPSAGSGVRTNTYGGFDDSYFDGLWWGPFSSTAVGIALDGIVDEPTETLVLNSTSFGPGWMSGTGSSIVDLLFPASPLNVQTRYRIYVYDLLNAPVPIVTAASLGLGAGAPALLADVYDAVVDTGGFRVDLRAEAWNGSTWMPVNTYYSALQYTRPDCDIDGAPGYQSGGCVRVSLNGGFFYDAPQDVSEPATLASLGLGALALGWATRRRPPRASALTHTPSAAPSCT